MITVLTGENSFEIHEALQALRDAFDGQPEQFDGSMLTLNQLPEMMMGSSLFAEKRLVVIHDLSLNNDLWTRLTEWLPRVSDDIHLVLVETKPDKRTSSYKALKELANLQEFVALNERDRTKVEEWVVKRAQERSVPIDTSLARHLVERVGVDQWQLSHAIDKLALVDVIDRDTIDEVIDAIPSENVFQLFELALSGKRERLRDILRTLELTEDPYTVFALLSSQVLQLVALAMAEETDNPVKDFGIHPYVAGKLKAQAKKMSKRDAQQLSVLFAKADADIKTSRGEPWLVIEQALLKVTS